MATRNLLFKLFIGIIIVSVLVLYEPVYIANTIKVTFDGFLYTINAKIISNNNTKYIKYYKVNRGKWIQLAYKNCVISDEQWFDNTYYNTTQLLYDDIFDNKTFKKEYFLYNNINKYNKYCNYNKTNKFPEWLYNIHSKTYQVYINKYYKEYYYLYNSNEINKCFIKHKNILFLGDSTLQNKFQEIFSFIINDDMITPYQNNKSTFNNFSITHNSKGGGRWQKINYINDLNQTYKGVFHFTDQKVTRNFGGIWNMDLEYFRSVILNENITTILFNSLAHDIARYILLTFNKDDKPELYYQGIKKFILYILTETHNTTNIYIWSGIRHYGPYHFLGTMWLHYPIYLNTMIKAINDIKNEYKQYSHLLKFIDTAHVSDGFNSTEYGDGLHYGFVGHKHDPNASRIVSKMSTQIILNQLCPL